MSIQTNACIGLTAIQIFLASAALPSTVGESGCSVMGHVTDSVSGQALRGVALELSRLAPPKSGPSLASSQHFEETAKTVASSGAEGEFCFSGVPPGQYVLAGKKAGFLVSPYGARSPDQQSMILNVGSDEAPRITLQMLPASAITGTVTDDHGDPVPSGIVQLVRATTLRGIRRYVAMQNAVPNDRGEYRLGGLAPGAYFIRFQPAESEASQAQGAHARQRRRLLPTYFPSATALADAGAIAVGLGQELVGTDIVARKGETYTIKGSLLAAGQAPAFASISLMPEGEEPAAIVFGNTILGRNGEFAIERVPSGQYCLLYAAGFESGISTGRLSVAVADRDVADLIIDAAAPVSVRGTVIAEGADAVDLSKLKISLDSSVGLLGPAYSGSPQADGLFEIHNCSPGEYLISVASPPGTYLKALYHGSAEMTNGMFRLDGSGAVLTVVVRQGAAKLRGRVSVPGASDVRGVSAYYIVAPADGAFADQSFRFGSADMEGSFAVNDLRPGRYIVFAVAAPDLAMIRNPGAIRLLKPLGAEVVLHEGENASVITNLISVDEQAGALRSLR